MFALQNIIRLVVECAVGLIRSGSDTRACFEVGQRVLSLDFTPAVNSSMTSAVLHSSQSSISSLGGSPFTGVDELANDEIVRLHDEHKQLAEKNRE